MCHLPGGNWLSLSGMHPFHQLTLLRRESALSPRPEGPAAWPASHAYREHGGTRSPPQTCLPQPPHRLVGDSSILVANTLGLPLTPSFSQTQLPVGQHTCSALPSQYIRDLTMAPSPTPKNLAGTAIVFHRDCWNSLVASHWLLPCPVQLILNTVSSVMLLNYVRSCPSLTAGGIHPTLTKSRDLSGD